MKELLLDRHIESKPGVCGGKPCIAGTRIRVWDIHIWHNLRGQSPAEIIGHFPQLTLADVHAGLAYYYDHREEIEAEMKKVEDFVARMEVDQGPTRFSKLRDRNVTEKDDHADQVSSG